MNMVNLFVGIILLVVLYLILAGPIKAAVAPLFSIGTLETGEITAAKESCIKQQTKGCAVEVANLLLLEKEVKPLEVKSWLEKEMSFPKSREDVEVIRDVFNAGKVLQKEFSSCITQDLYNDMIKLTIKDKSLQNEIQAANAPCKDYVAPKEPQTPETVPAAPSTGYQIPVQPTSGDM